MEVRREQTSSARQDLGGCLLVVALQDESLEPFCLVGVGVSCSGFMEGGSRRSLGLRPKANSMGLPLKVTCVFLTVAPLRINWAGVICANKVVWSRRFLEAKPFSSNVVLFSRTTRFLRTFFFCIHCMPDSCGCSHGMGSDLAFSTVA